MADNTSSTRKRTQTDEGSRKTRKVKRVTRKDEEEFPGKRSRRSVVEVAATPKSRATRGAKAGNPDTPSVSTPDTPSVSTPDTPSVSTPDTPSVSTPDTPSVSTPDTPSVSTPDTPKTNRQRGVRRAAKPAVPGQRLVTPNPTKIAKGATGRKSTTQNRRSCASKKFGRDASDSDWSPSESESSTNSSTMSSSDTSSELFIYNPSNLFYGSGAVYYSSESEHMVQEFRKPAPKEEPKDGENFFEIYTPD